MDSRAKRIYHGLGMPKARNASFPNDRNGAEALHAMDWMPEKVRREWKEKVNEREDVLVAMGERKGARKPWEINPYERKTLAERMASGCKSNSPYHMIVGGERWIQIPKGYMKKGPIVRPDGTKVKRTEQHWIEYQRRVVTRHNNKWSPRKWSLFVDRREKGGVLVTGVILRRVK